MAASLNRVSSSIVLLELVVIVGAGGAELDAGDRAVAAGILLDVLEVGPDLALGRAAAGGEDADDPVLLLVAEVEPAADLGPLEPPRHALADDALALARRRGRCPATILKSGRSLREAGWTPRTMILVRVPFSRSAIGIFSSSLAASGWPCSSRAMPGRVRSSSAFDDSNPPVVSLVEPLPHHDQVERVARDGQAVLQALDQAEEDARRPDDQARAQHGHQRRLPADPEVADVVFERDHGVFR